MTMPYQIFADAVLVLHLGLVVFIVAGLVLIVAGGLRGWRWVNARGFRLAHLVAIGFVVAQAWLGRICPLTTLEAWLRAKAGAPAYPGAFIQHWVQQILFYDAPPWVFTLAYTIFGVLVISAWWRFPPRRRKAPQP